MNESDQDDNNLKILFVYCLLPLSATGTIRLAPVSSVSCACLYRMRIIIVSTTLFLFSVLFPEIVYFIAGAIKIQIVCLEMQES